LRVTESHWLVDCTLGGGGHCEALLEAFEAHPLLKNHQVLASDRDPDAVHFARQRLQRFIDSGRLEVVHGSFTDLVAYVQGRPVLGLLADLGFSSDQLVQPGRGLSFQRDDPLDMRLNPSSGFTCLDFLNEVSAAELERVLLEYGQERFAKRIAQNLVLYRSQGKLPQTTKQLVAVIVNAVPRSARHGRLHIATRTFQALRMVVNQEPEQLEGLLSDVLPHLAHDARACFLSFHSLEDRQVKRYLKASSLWVPVGKPLRPSRQEIVSNPRSRSAKLRFAEKSLIGDNERRVFV